MSWWSRLLGEIPEETKYKPTNQYTIRDNGNTIKIENYAKEYQSNDAAQLFAKAFAKKYDSDDALGSLTEIDKKIEDFNKIPININTNELEKLSKYISLGFMLIFLIIFTIGIIFSTPTSKSPIILIILFSIIFGVLSSIKKSKKKKINSFT